MVVTYSALAALVVALLLTVLSVVVFRKTGPWGSGWMLFVILFLALWTVSLYVRSLGPVYLGVAWFPMLIAGILLALLFAAVLPDANHWRDESIRDTPERKFARTYLRARSGVNKVYWVLIIFLVVAIIIGMMNPQMAF